jgi:hypothetical protein
VRRTDDKRVAGPAAIGSWSRATPRSNLIVPVATGLAESTVQNLRAKVLRWRHATDSTGAGNRL